MHGPSQANRCRANNPAIIAAALAIGYAVFAGLHTVGDLDLGWQLAMGRWIVQHRQVPTLDVLSYTAQIKEWIYPPLSSVLLYVAHALGGWELLSWIGAIACATTVVAVLDTSLAVNTIAVIAVPLIADRTSPRADMFTCILFAIYLRVLWSEYKTGRGRLWLLPLLMMLWVNLHLGFISGLALWGAYFLMQLGDVGRGVPIAAVFDRIRKALPYFTASLLATLINPWTWRIFLAISRQGTIQAVHQKWITEWAGAPLNRVGLEQAVNLRAPESALWTMLATAVVAIFLAVRRRSFGVAIVLAASVYVVVTSMRFQGLFAILVVVAGGDLIAEWLGSFRLGDPGRMRLVWSATLVAIFALVSLRIADLVTNRAYLRSPTRAVFGARASYWYPEDAANFLLANSLPRNIFNDFNLGNYAAWRLLPNYPVYIDGRSVPYSTQFFFRAIRLTSEPLDSSLWRSEAEARNINTIFVSVDRSVGGGLSNLDRFCNSQDWAPVYLDTRAAIFTRMAGASPLVQTLRIRCQDVLFSAPPAGDGIRARTDRFNYCLNSAAIMIVLGENRRALSQLNLAERIFPASSELHSLKGLALQYLLRSREAEEEFLLALKLDSSETNARALADLYQEQGRYAEAAGILEQALHRSDAPFQLYLELGEVQVKMGRMQEALHPFSKAEKSNIFVGDAAEIGESFQLRIAQGKAAAMQGLQSVPTH